VGSCSVAARYGSESTTSIQLDNFPNPFSDYTDIELTVAEAGNVSVTVYDQTGHEVSVVLKGSLSEGTHRLPFDASQLKPGIYLVHVTANGKTVRQKIIKME
jgi:hypothetical protein